MALNGITQIVITTDVSSEKVQLDAYPPAQYSIAKKVAWQDAKTRGVQLAVPHWNGGSRTFSLSVVYDSYEKQEKSERDVRTLTRQLTRLAEPLKDDKGRKRPPVCTITWGAAISAEPYTGLPFSGVVDSVTQRFTLFDPDGTPVRATVDISFRETRPPEKQIKEGGGSERNSPLPARSHVVRRGDSLWAIAHAKLADPARWREIARANGIVDPHQLEPGTVLLVPAAE